MHTFFFLLAHGHCCNYSLLKLGFAVCTALLTDGAGRAPVVDAAVGAAAAVARLWPAGARHGRRGGG